MNNSESDETLDKDLFFADSMSDESIQEVSKPQKVNPKNVGYLVDGIFGVDSVADEFSLQFDRNKEIPAIAQNEKLSIEIAKVFEEILYTLTPREEKVIRMRFGLEGNGKFQTLGEVGQHFAVTNRRLREIESKALRKLRHPSRTRFFLEHDSLRNI